MTPTTLHFSTKISTSPSIFPLHFNPRHRRSHLVCAQKCRPPSLRYAVLGAGFAGLSVAWHLLKHCPKEYRICLDIFDEIGIGGGASGASGGLLHPYSPKARVLWRGAECWSECLKLIAIAERTMEGRVSNSVSHDSSSCVDGPIVLRRGILKPAMSEKNVEILKENAKNCLHSCNLEVLDRNAAHCLVPDLHVPFNSAIYMPRAMNIHPKRYLQALYLACQSLSDDVCASDCEEREINLYKRSIDSIHELAGDYDAVIICLGAQANMLPELSGKLPLRTCRGVIAQLKLLSDNATYANLSEIIWLKFITVFDRVTL